MDLKELCMRLAKANDEDEVVTILKQAGYWDSDKAWVPFNGDRNNYSTIGNQTSRADAALVEKIVNSVDAMLMGECLARGENTHSKDVPKSIEEAVEKYFGAKNGRLAYLTPGERSHLAENICLVATGKRSTPCYSIIDKGEGQSPVGIKNTILALSKENKVKIPFVQGKFHMGGTGVIRFLSSKKLQLIISKRNPNIAANEQEPFGDEWCFTVLRREFHQNYKSSVITYLAPEKDSGILHFKSNTLPLLPGQYPEAYESELEYGTFIKLYQYELKGLKSPLLLDAYNRLSLLLPGIALPIRLYERRKGYKAHSYEATLAGLKVRLDTEKKKLLEEGFPDSSELRINKEKMRVTIHVFQKGKSENYRKNEGVIFTVNGQTHGQIDDSFFRRQKVGMSYLASSLLLICDCSEFGLEAREDLFMNSRDRLSDEGILRPEIEKELMSLLANHSGLRDLVNKRKQEELGEKLSDSKPLVGLLQKAMKTHPSLAHLLKGKKDKRLSNPFDIQHSGSGTNFEGKKYPSFFRLTKKPKEGLLTKHCPINKKFRVQFETDVFNDYFDRDECRGEFQIRIGAYETDDYVLNLWNGTANLTVSLPSDVVPGEVIEYTCTVTDETQIEPFIESFQVICEEAEKKKKGVQGNRKHPPDDKSKGEHEIPDDLGLPDVVEVRHDDLQWKNLNFDENTALKVMNDGQSYQFFVNMHNIHLLHEIKAQSTKEPKILETQFKFGLTLLGIALLQEEKGRDSAEDTEEMIGKVTRQLSSVLLPIIDTLGEIEL